MVPKIIGAKQEYHSGNIHLYQMDCNDLMPQLPDKWAELSIVDPPYGKRPMRDDNGTWGSPGTRKFDSKDDKWDIRPNKKYFDELFRVSKNQIIWGGNYFIDYLMPTNCFVVWDKKTGENLFADCDLAWTSFTSVTKKYTQLWLGSHCNDVLGLIHPTQKPVQLYKWLLKNYAKPEFKIFDSHLGSGSSTIAAYDFNIAEFIGCEIDKEYYDAAVKRFNIHKMQQKLF